MVLSYSALSNTDDEIVFANPDIEGKLITRSLIGGMGIVAIFYSLSHFPLYICNTFLNSSIVFTYLLLIYSRKERFSFSKIALVLTCIAGCFLVVHPDAIYLSFSVADMNYSVTSIAVVMFASFIKGLVPVLIANIGPHNPNHNALYFSISSVFFSGVMLILMGQGINIFIAVNVIFFTINGIFGYFMQVTKVMSLRYENGVIVGMIENLTMIYAFVWDGIKRKEMVLGGWIGGFLVLASGIIYSSIQIRNKK